MKKFVIFSLLMSLSTGLAVYFKSPPEGEQSDKNSTDRPAQLKDIISLKPASSVFAHVQSTGKETSAEEVLSVDSTLSVQNKDIAVAEAGGREQEYLTSSGTVSLQALPFKEKLPQVQSAAVPSAVPSPPPSNTRIAAKKPSEPKILPTTTSPQPRKLYVIPPQELEISITTLKSLAAEDPRASYDLSLRYFRGDGVRQDSYEALKWMRDAAERGDRAAQKEIGKLYMTGLEEMGSDFREAQKWLTIAASAGDKEAKALLQEVKQGRLQEDQQYEMRSSTYPSAFGEMDSSYRMYWLRGQWRSY